jgi:hypothetical protein
MARFEPGKKSRVMCELPRGRAIRIAKSSLLQQIEDEGGSETSRAKKLRRK